jgi:hypothetical protein
MYLNSLLRMRIRGLGYRIFLIRDCKIRIRDKHPGSATLLKTVFRIRIRIHRIHMFLGHPDPLVRGMDPDPDPALECKNSKIT